VNLDTIKHEVLYLLNPNQVKRTVKGSKSELWEEMGLFDEANRWFLVRKSNHRHG
jgi:hypothetical protein